MKSEPVWPSGQALWTCKQKKLGWINSASALFALCGQRLLTLSFTINETLNGSLTALPIFMQESFGLVVTF